MNLTEDEKEEILHLMRAQASISASILVILAIFVIFTLF